MSTETAHPLEDGTLVRLSRELTEDEHNWVALPHGRDRITVNDFFTAGDPDQNEIPVDFYEAHDEHGCTVVIPANAVEVVKTAGEMAARRVPTPELIAKELGITEGWSDAFDIDEWVRSGDEIECYGRTSDGLPFGFRVKVVAAWETDL